MRKYDEVMMANPNRKSLKELYDDFLKLFQEEKVKLRGGFISISNKKAVVYVQRDGEYFLQVSIPQKYSFLKGFLLDSIALIIGLALWGILSLYVGPSFLFSIIFFGIYIPTRKEIRSLLFNNEKLNSNAVEIVNQIETYCKKERIAA